MITRRIGCEGNGVTLKGPLGTSGTTGKADCILSTSAPSPSLKKNGDGWARQQKLWGNMGSKGRSNSLSSNTPGLALNPIHNGGQEKKKRRKKETVTYDFV